MQQRLDLARRAQEAAAKQLAAVAASRRRMQLRHIAQRLAADAASCGADGNKSPGAVGAVAGPPGRICRAARAAALEELMRRWPLGAGKRRRGWRARRPWCWWVPWLGWGGSAAAAGGEKGLRGAPSSSGVERLRTGLGVFEQGWPADLSKLDLNWVTFFVNHGKPHRARNPPFLSGACPT